MIARDILDRENEALERDPDTGLAPVEQYVASFVVEAGDLDESDAGDSTLVSVREENRLGRMPCEALHELLISSLDETWWRHEPEVIFSALAGVGALLDAAGHNKVHALRVVLGAPLENNPFYRHPGSFLFLTANLMGRPVFWGEMPQPTSVETALTISVVGSLRPQGFSDGVLGTIASCCLADSLWCLPDVLAPAQDRALEILRYEEMGIGIKDLEDLRERLLEVYPDLTKALTDGKYETGADLNLPDPDEEGITPREVIRRVQLWRVVDHLDRFERLYMRGQQMRDQVLRETR